MNGFHIMVYFFLRHRLRVTTDFHGLSIRMSQNQFSEVKQETRHISFADLESQISIKNWLKEKEKRQEYLFTWCVQLNDILKPVFYITI